jgi:uncharacterized protein
MEPDTQRAQNWLTQHRPADFILCAWLLVEVQSALSIKQRRAEITQEQHQQISNDIADFVSNMPTLVEPIAADFATAANLCKKASSRLRAGDALHLSIALRLGAAYIVTLDDVLKENAIIYGLKDGLSDP